MTITVTRNKEPVIKLVAAGVPVPKTPLLGATIGRMGPVDNAENRFRMRISGWISSSISRFEGPSRHACAALGAA